MMASRSVLRTPGVLASRAATRTPAASVAGARVPARFSAARVSCPRRDVAQRRSLALRATDDDESEPKDEEDKPEEDELPMVDVGAEISKAAAVANAQIDTAAAELSNAISEATSPEPEPEPIKAAPEPVSSGWVMTTEDIKACLLDTTFGTDLGLNASSEVRAEVNELIAQLEAKNPTPSPTEAEELLGGSWKLAYTSNSELLPLIAAGQIPGIEITAIYQDIDPATMTVDNRVELKGPLGTGSVAASAQLEVQSPKRVRVKFNKGTIGTPQLVGGIQLPSSVEFMGNMVDVSPVSTLLGPLADIANQAVSSVAGVVSQQPDLEVPIGVEGAQGWLLTTYLDETLRISRGDLGSVFVLIKEDDNDFDDFDDEWDFE